VVLKKTRGWLKITVPSNNPIKNLKNHEKSTEPKVILPFTKNNRAR